MKLDTYTASSGYTWTRLRLNYDEIVRISNASNLMGKHFFLLVLFDHDTLAWRVISEGVELANASDLALGSLTVWDSATRSHEWQKVANYIRDNYLKPNVIQTVRKCDCPMDILMGSGCQCGGK